VCCFARNNSEKAPNFKWSKMGITHQILLIDIGCGLFRQPLTALNGA
jgi:hypothetical protein